MLQIDLWLTPQEIVEIESEDAQGLVWKTAYDVSRFHGDQKISTGAYIRWVAKLAEEMLDPFARNLNKGVVTLEDVRQDFQKLLDGYEQIETPEINAAKAILDMTPYQVYKIAQKIEKAGIDVLEELSLYLASGEESGTTIARAMADALDKELRLIKARNAAARQKDDWAGFPVVDPNATR